MLRTTGLSHMASEKDRKKVGNTSLIEIRGQYSRVNLQSRSTAVENLLRSSVISEKKLFCATVAMQNNSGEHEGLLEVK